MLKNSNPIIVVAGDPKSVFLELYFKAFKKFKNTPLILIANKKLLIDQMKLLNFKASIRNINPHKKNFFQSLDNKKINLIDIFLSYESLEKINLKDSNIYIEKCFNVAINLLKKNKIFNLINGPIIKKDFLKKKQPGITEYLAKKYNKIDEVVMLIYNKNLAVSPITTHIPLKNVSKFLTKKKIINHVKKIQKFYKKRFNKNPSFAITGLNPHCESNSKSNEEDKIIRPAIKFLHKKNYKILGPFSADTIFLRENIKKFDVIIGMYHDQVLTPIKTIYGFDAINITLGLPFIRVSPDHGPNSLMFGKNESNANSLLRSIEFLSK